MILKLLLLQCLLIVVIWLFLVNQCRIWRIISLSGVFATATSCRQKRFLNEIRLGVYCHMRPWFIGYTIVPTTSIRLIPRSRGGRYHTSSFHIIRTRWSLFWNENRGWNFLLPTLAILSRVTARAIPSFSCEYKFVAINSTSEATGFWGWSRCGRHPSLGTYCFSWLLMKNETWCCRNCITIDSFMLLLLVIIQGYLTSFQRLHIQLFWLNFQITRFEWEDLNVFALFYCAMISGVHNVAHDAFFSRVVLDWGGIWAGWPFEALAFNSLLAILSIRRRLRRVKHHLRGIRNRKCRRILHGHWASTNRNFALLRSSSLILLSQHRLLSLALLSHALRDLALSRRRDTEICLDSLTWLTSCCSFCFAIMSGKKGACKFSTSLVMAFLILLGCLFRWGRIRMIAATSDIWLHRIEL